MRAALLLLLALAPAAASDTPDDMAGLLRIEAEYDALTVRLQTDIDRLVGIDHAFPLAPVKELHIQRRRELSWSIQEMMERETELRNRHGRHLEAQELALLTWAMASRVRGLGRDPAQEKKFVNSETYRDKMNDIHNRFELAINSENDYFARLEQAYMAGKRRRRAAWGGAALALLLSAGALAARTRRPQAAPPKPHELPAAAPIPPSFGPDFAVLRLLGSGSMGEVYEAIEKTRDRRTALRRLRPELLQDPAGLEDLLKEARRIASLEHPNLVAIYSVGKDAGQVYVALEYVDGVSLKRRLDTERRLPWPEALRIAKGVGAALDHAHERKVIHLDLKPAVIMLSLKGEVKVMDFGLAHKAAKLVSQLTRWGTPPYMAPEQELGGVSAAVDIYALSVCLYEMLTGELPFKGPNFLAQKREGLYVPPSTLAAGLPARVDALFAAALAPEPSRRFKTASALMAACDALNS